MLLYKRLTVQLNAQDLLAKCVGDTHEKNTAIPVRGEDARRFALGGLDDDYRAAWQEPPQNRNLRIPINLWYFTRQLHILSFVTEFPGGTEKGSLLA